MICVVLNRKGGTAKSSTCFHLAGTFAKQGKRVLLIDTDPQANLSEGLLGSRVEGLDPSRSLAVLFSEEYVADSRSLIVPTPIEGVFILPGSDRMESYNQPDPSGHTSQNVIRDFLEEVKGEFDVVLIDCPPNLGLCSWAAMTAGDGVLVPVQAEDFGAQGLKKLNRAMNLVRAEVNPSLRLYGYLITMFNKSLAIHTAYAQQLRKVYGEQVFKTQVPLATDYKVAVTSSTPVSHYKPKSAAAKAMEAVAEELLTRSTPLEVV